MGLLGAVGSASQVDLDAIRSELHAGGITDVETQKRLASLQNLDDEDRMGDAAVAAFQAGACGSLLGTAMEKVQAGCAESTLSLEVDSANHHRIEGDWYLYRPKDWLKYDQRTGPSTSPTLRIRSEPSQAPLTLTQLLGTKRDGSVGSFWVTTYRPSNVDTLPDRLGLAHYDRPGEVYRVRTPIVLGRPAYIPTCTDANAYHAWRRPGPGHTEPWGMTMHLATAKESEPELLLTDHAADERVAYYVGTLTATPSTAYLARRLGL